MSDDKMTNQSHSVDISDAVSVSVSVSVSVTVHRHAANVQSTSSPHLRQEPLDEQCAAIDRWLEVDVSFTCLSPLHLY